MASTQEFLALQLYRCYHCGLESTDSSFKYFDNKKVDQPRHQCHHCHKFFTLGSHGRPQGKTYAKKRNEDPVELKSLPRQCCHCGVADNALFKYYNNHNLLQPRFKCLSCGRQFQMRLLGTGKERRLVHTSSQQRSTPRCRKQGMFAIASNGSKDGSYQPFDGSFIQVPTDPLMPLEYGTRLLPEMSDEDVQYSDYLETELAAEENIEANFISWIGNGDNGSLPPPLSAQDAQYSNSLEIELLAKENIEAPNVDAFSSTTNGDGALPQAWSNEDVELMDFIKASVGDNEAPNAHIVSDNMAEMIFESTSNSTEVINGTLVVDTSAVSDSNSWSPNDTLMDSSSMSYRDAAIACCYEMDMDMAHKNSMLPTAPVQAIGESSSSSSGSTIVFADPFRILSEPQLVQQAFTEDEQCSDFHWNEDDEAEDYMEMTPWPYLLAT